MTSTPETDNLARGNHVVPTEFAQQLERERDEARFDLDFRRRREKIHVEIVHDAIRERDEAQQQRDRLAEALQEIRSGYGGQMTDPDCNCDDCKFLIEIDTALQSLTPNEL
jgi:hypothetical protein